jgi:hypothetical protein
MLGEWTNPSKPDLVFKQTFKVFNERWRNHFGWPIIKPLSPEDEHFYAALRVPLAERQAEFDSQVLALSKVSHRLD